MSRTVLVVERIGDSDVKVISEPLTYDEAVNVLRALDRAGSDPLRYDLLSTETGRLLSWVL